MFEPRVALASLSGASDADWAAAGAPYAGAAFLGGIALCEPTRAAARKLVRRDRAEFLPADPFAFIDEQFRALEPVDIRPAINVRATNPDAVSAAGEICARHDAILEINAHCRQAEMCAVGSGERLLQDTDRLVRCVRAARVAPAVSVKVRAELAGVDLAETAGAIADAGADAIHVDAMDSEEVIEAVAEASDLFVIANNGVRDRATVHEYFEYGADAVSVGRPSDQPAVLARVLNAVESCISTTDTGTHQGDVDDRGEDTDPPNTDRTPFGPRNDN